MKRVLIISPHFPPVNAADMQRVRHSLPYFKEMGWEAEVVTVNLEYVEQYSVDNLLMETIPTDVKVHYVDAYEASKTRKFGLGSLSMRSFFHYRKYVDRLLKKQKFDLIYFSTTLFHVMALGPHWKKKFGVPFILDIQDPWRNDFYLDKPKSERPPKFFLSYNIDKYLEAYTMKAVDGIISVSNGYVDTLTERYANLSKDMFKVIPFGYSTLDFDVMEKNVTGCSKVRYSDGVINVTYVGRGGHDMRLACACLFQALKNVSPQKKIHFWFVGTSYALEGQGAKTIEPIAEEYGVEAMVTEVTDRVPFFETLYLLKNADALFIPGSTDMSYTASKVYQYVLSQKELLAIFYKKSSVVTVLETAGVGSVVTFDDSLKVTEVMIAQTEAFIRNILQSELGEVKYNRDAFEVYSAKYMTKLQVDFFEKTLNTVPV